MSEKISRSDFLKKSGLAAAGVMMGGMTGSSSLFAAEQQDKKERFARLGKVNIAWVGMANRGREVMREFERTGLANIVAMCDVDPKSKGSQESIKAHPDAKVYTDFRKMFDEMGNKFEAVVVETPDFSHFPCVMLALNQGKHVYVEKPMGRTFLECELMIAAAKRNPNLVTQGGNQGHSEANYFQFREWVKAGIIKDVTHVDAHMNNSRRWHGYDVNIDRYPQAEPIPAGMDWDLWHTTQQFHEFNGKYHPGNWRSWYDFGMGALGDWGAHLIDTIHEFLDLGLPTEITPIKFEGWNTYFFPMSSTINFKFPRRGKMPAMDITWWDGIGNYPPVPEGYGVSKMSSDVPMINGKPAAASAVKLNPGTIMYSKDLIFKRGSHGATTQIIPEAKAKEMESKLPEVPKSPSNHYENFLLACMGEEKTRSPFEKFGPLCQVFCLGVMAQRLNEKIIFDRETKRIVNNRFADAMLTSTPPRKGWEEFYKM
ncbi:MAG: Gfo/Idh/MocA family oxidoreductase [Alistipes sp.]|nr:Gfo/Idh/MocA family oxidoreductase [Alistipes sp.]MBQ5785847.1 Gfo/Idh/MocA family oxidoreductase [Alistipes sp.]